MHDAIKNLIGLIIILAALLFFTNLARAEEYSYDEICDAIFLAEGGYNAKYLYGIRSVKYESETEAREICVRTVKRTVKTRFDVRCKGFVDPLECLANRYAPMSASNDPRGLNRYWLKNVRYFLKKRRSKS